MKRYKMFCAFRPISPWHYPGHARWPCSSCCRNIDAIQDLQPETRAQPLKIPLAIPNVILKGSLVAQRGWSIKPPRKQFGRELLQKLWTRYKELQTQSKQLGMQAHRLRKPRLHTPPFRWKLQFQVTHRMVWLLRYPYLSDSQSYEELCHVYVTFWMKRQHWCYNLSSLQA